MIWNWLIDCIIYSNIEKKIWNRELETDIENIEQKKKNLEVHKQCQEAMAGCLIKGKRLLGENIQYWLEYTISNNHRVCDHVGSRDMQG